MFWTQGAYVSRRLFALPKDLPYDFSMLETSLVNLIACTLLYSLLLTFQNAPGSSIIVLVVERQRSWLIFHRWEKSLPEMLSDVLSLGNSMKSNSQSGACSILSDSLFDRSASTWHFTVCIFIHITSITVTAILWYRSIMSLSSLMSS